MIWVFSYHPDHRIYQVIGSFYEEPGGSLHAVYIGSSNCYAFWNHLVAWNNYGLAIHPYSVASLPFYATEYLIKEARKTQPNALFIVNINAVEQDDLSAAAIHGLVNYMPDSELKTELTNYLSDLIGYSALEKLEFVYPWIRIREFWPYLFVNGIQPELDGSKGVSTYASYLNTSQDISDSYMLNRWCEELPYELEDCVDSLLDYCDRENVNVLFVSVPRAEVSETALGRINTVADMVTARGYPVLYLTDCVEEIGLDLTQDFYDGKHANIHGSIKFTNYVSEYLIENYAFDDRRGNALYNSWDIAWKNYAASITPYIFDFELDDDHRNYSLIEPKSLNASCVEADIPGIEIDWDDVDGANGYVIFRRTGSYGEWQSLCTVIDGSYYQDFGVEAGKKYSYTVVPVAACDGEIFYGNFSYKGISVEVPPAY